MATPLGPARVLLHLPGVAKPTAVLLLGHGAGGGVAAPDLHALAIALSRRQLAVALLEQPYRVAGRRAPAPAGQLDLAFAVVAGAVRARPELAGVPLVSGGRSSGARVACRTAAAVGAAGVLCLAFPLVPPGRPDRSRAGELLALDVPSLVVQGARDAFGTAADLRRALADCAGVRVHEVAAADHAFAVRRSDRRTAAAVADELVAVVDTWLSRLLA
ncbi:MAG: alpha/beta hydrolase [Actinomycetota bacterium]|nr:alpha/beta hydrolase [Actinomycetota bacterium]